MIDKKTLESILHLSRMDVDEADKESFRSQVGHIVDYFDLLKSYDTSGVDVDLGASVTKDDLREDVVQPSYTEEQLEKFAIHFTEGHFSVPHILEDFLENREDE